MSSDKSTIKKINWNERVEYLLEKFSPPQIDSYMLEGKEVKVFAPRNADGAKRQMVMPSLNGKGIL